MPLHSRLPAPLPANPRGTCFPSTLVPGHAAASSRRRWWRAMLPALRRATAGGGVLDVLRAADLSTWNPDGHALRRFPAL